MIFESRESAAYILVRKLKSYKGQNPLVLGIPRGAMPMAKIISDELNGELNGVLVHKIPFPGNEEFAVGCVGTSGHVHAMPFAAEFGVDNDYIQAEGRNQIEKLKLRQKKLGFSQPQIKDRNVIIVDDGIATGATAICAVFDVRSFKPRKLTFACAVSSKHAADEINKLVDEFIALEVSDSFFGISEFFRSFPQVTDDEVYEILKNEQTKKAKAAV